MDGWKIDGQMIVDGQMVGRTMSCMSLHMSTKVCVVTIILCIYNTSVLIKHLNFIPCIKKFYKPINASQFL